MLERNAVTGGREGSGVRKLYEAAVDRYAWIAKECAALGIAAKRLRAGPQAPPSWTRSASELDQQTDAAAIVQAIDAGLRAGGVDPTLPPGPRRRAPRAARHRRRELRGGHSVAPDSAPLSP